MPFVHVESIEGYTEEQLTDMIRGIIETMSKDASALERNTRVIVNGLKKDRYAQGGEWKKQVFREFLLDYLLSLKISG